MCQSSGDSSAGSDRFHAQGAIFRLPPAYYRRSPLLSRGFGSLYISGMDWEREFDGLAVLPWFISSCSINRLR
jgi:hypothetical protein